MKTTVKDLNDYVERKEVVKILKEIQSNNDYILIKAKYLRRLMGV